MSLAILSKNLQCLETLPVMISEEFSAHMQNIFFKRLTIICSIVLKPEYIDIPDLWNKLGLVTSEQETTSLLGSLFQARHLNLEVLSPATQVDLTATWLAGQPSNLEKIAAEILEQLGNNATFVEFDLLVSATCWMQKRGTVYFITLSPFCANFHKSLLAARKNLVTTPKYTTHPDCTLPKGVGIPLRDYGFPKFLDSPTLSRMIDDVFKDNQKLESLPTKVKPLLVNTIFNKENLPWNHLIKALLIYKTFPVQTDTERSFIRTTLLWLRKYKDSTKYITTLEEFLTWVPELLLKHNYGPHPLNLNPEESCEQLEFTLT